MSLAAIIIIAIIIIAAASNAFLLKHFNTFAEEPGSQTLRDASAIKDILRWMIVRVH